MEENHNSDNDSEVITYPSTTKCDHNTPLLQSQANSEERDRQEPRKQNKTEHRELTTSTDMHNPSNHIEVHAKILQDNTDLCSDHSSLKNGMIATISEISSIPNGSAVNGSYHSFENVSRRRVRVEEVAPSHSSFVGDDWRLSLHLFTSKKRGNSAEDKRLPKRIRRYYKEQDKLITAFEEIQLEVDDAMENIQELANHRKKAERAAKVTFFFNLLLLIFKSIAAAISGSLSIFSAVIDSTVDLLSGIIMWWSNRAMKQQDPYSYPQGKTKLEPIAIIVLAVIMSLASIQMIREAIERIIYYAGDSSARPICTWPVMAICVCTVAIKVVLWLFIRRIQASSAQALAQDQRNDVLSNSVALAGALVGYYLWSFADPIGAIAICLYIIASWIITGKEQIQMLTGHTARPDFLKKITWIAVNHHPKVKFVDTVRVYHFGNNFLVEVDIVLPEDMKLRESHDIGESLQLKIEKLPEVERAFVHLDYEWEHDPYSEHKQVWKKVV